MHQYIKFILFWKDTLHVSDRSFRPSSGVQYCTYSNRKLSNRQQYLFLFPTSACNIDTTPTQPHWNSNTHRTINNTTNVVIQQNSRKLLMMDILMSETCWAHKKWNKITSDIKLIFCSSTTSTCFGHICSPSSGGILYIYCTVGTGCAESTK